MFNRTRMLSRRQLLKEKVLRYYVIRELSTEGTFIIKGTATPTIIFTSSDSSYPRPSRSVGAGSLPFSDLSGTVHSYIFAET
jgi:hypothetical protein